MYTVDVYSRTLYLARKESEQTHKRNLILIIVISLPYIERIPIICCVIYSQQMYKHQY